MDNRLIVFLDASTPPSTEGCQYKGTSYSDGAAWTDTIDCTSCTCHAGHVTCNFTCEEPVVPEGCVNPVTRTADYGCCAIIVCDSGESFLVGWLVA